MQATGHFDLDNFLEKVYQMTFPSAPVVMECTFKNIRQKSDETIVEYGRRFQLFCSKLDRALHTQYLKFIEGLSDGSVRSHLIKSPYSSLTFLQIMNHAISIEQSISSTRGKAIGSGDERAHLLASVDFDVDDNTARILKIFDKDIGFYMNESTNKKLPTGTCWNCLTALTHRAYRCPQKTCRFCLKETSKAKHYSINCQKCPSDLTQINKQKDGWNATRARTIKAVEEPIPEEFLNLVYDHEDK